MSFYDDMTIENKIWEKQIGTNVTVGFDFAGREIHMVEYENYSSKYGWTLIDFGDDEFLVVNVLTKQEFPKDIEKQQNEEFVVNGNIFSITKNNENGWDINLIEYKQSDTSTSTFNLDIENDKKEEFDETDENEYKDEYEQGKLFSKASNKKESNMNDHEVNRILKSQEREIKLLENEIRQEKEKTQIFKIENNEKILQELKKQLMHTKEINNSNTLNLDKYKNFDNSSTLDFNRDTKSFDFTSNINRSNLIEHLTKKMNEQTLQLESLKMNEKLNKMRLEDIEKSSSIPSAVYLKQWELQFGNASFGVDFAGRIISKDKFNSNEDGGWNVDYYNKDLSSSFYIASTKSIIERNGQSKFIIDETPYVVENDGKNWTIKKYSAEDKRNANNLPKNFLRIAKNIQPDEYKEFSGTSYNTYSSLLINLEHFPLQQLNKFDFFLRKTLDNLPYFKDLFIYSNERVYEKNESNISAYARIFFKSESIRDDIEILLLSVSLKKAMKRFISKFKFSSRNDLLSFTIFLYNHGKTLKFIHAQTNFELLRIHPIPLRLPQECLIVDKEYNSTLKFHENNLWKKLRPYAIDQHNTTYYICEIDLDDIDAPMFSLDY